MCGGPKAYIHVRYRVDGRLMEPGPGPTQVREITSSTLPRAYLTVSHFYGVRGTPPSDVTPYEYMCTVSECSAPYIAVIIMSLVSHDTRVYYARTLRLYISLDTTLPRNANFISIGF